MGKPLRGNTLRIGAIATLLIAGIAVGAVMILRSVNDEGPSVRGALALTVDDSGEVVVVVRTCAVELTSLTITAFTRESVFDGRNEYSIETEGVDEDSTARVPTGLTVGDFPADTLFSLDAQTDQPQHHLDPVKFYREEVAQLDSGFVSYGDAQGTRMVRDATGIKRKSEDRFVETHEC